MTLMDLCRLLGRYWKLVVALPVVCVAICAAVLFAQPGASASASATARVVSNSQVAIVYGHAASLARQLEGADPDYAVSAKADGNSMTVSVTATGPDEAECLQLADAVAADAVAATEQDFAENEGSEFLVAFRAQVEPAELDDAAASGGKLKYLAVALLGGLFVAVCVVVLIDLKRRHVKSAGGVQDAVELPVLEILPAVSGERLLANVRFASKVDDLGSVCVIPAGDGTAAERACEALEQGAQVEGAQLQVVRCEALSQGMAGAYKAREADAVVVTARQWADSLTQLESTVAELRLADAKLVGIVYANGKL